MAKRTAITVDRQIFEAFLSIRNDLKKAYKGRQGKYPVDYNSTMVHLLGKYENGQAIRYLNEINELKGRIEKINTECNERIAREREIIKKYVEGIRFSNGQTVKLEYDKIQGLDKFDVKDSE